MPSQNVEMQSQLFVLLDKINSLNLGKLNISDLFGSGMDIELTVEGLLSNSDSLNNVISLKKEWELFYLKCEGLKLDSNQVKGNDAWTPAHIAARFGYARVLERLGKLEGVDLNKKIGHDGRTPAHIAAQYGHANVLEQLGKLEGVDLNKGDKNDRTPAHIAAQYGHANVLEQLGKLEGVDLNKGDKNGMTPAHIAAQHGHANVLEQLGKLKGVDLNSNESKIN